MNMQQNTILITGGSSGIGLELARQLLALGNTVIIAGRDATRLAAAKAALPGVHTAVCDVADPAAITRLHAQLLLSHPALNMLVNCAGEMRKLNLNSAGLDLQDATREITTNLNGTIWSCLQFLPTLRQQRNAAIVNVSSGLAFVPLPIVPVYCATKSAVHAFTRSLRVQLKGSGVRIIELAPPGTDTPLFYADFDKEDLEGMTPMPVATLAAKAIVAMGHDVEEIRPGLSNVLKIASRVAPEFMLRQLSKTVDRMVVKSTRPA